MGNSPEAGNNLLVLDIYKLCGETYTWILGKKKKKQPKKTGCHSEIYRVKLLMPTLLDKVFCFTLIHLYRHLWWPYGETFPAFI